MQIFSKTVNDSNKQQNIYKNVYFEIVGFCNAVCPWCPSGNKSMSNIPSRVIPPPEFKNAIEELIKKKLISPEQSIINLYNWGEPMLHPKIDNILDTLHKQGIFFGLSTNASKLADLDPRPLTHLRQFIFSMPGFSQTSYDHIHRLNFNTVKRNIETYCKLVSKAAPNAILTMSYHVYQFNLDEMEVAEQFCKDNGIYFSPFFAYLMDFNQSKTYLDHSMNSSLLRHVSRDLFLYYVDEQLSKSPLNYRCPQYDILHIDEYCNVILCCVISKSHHDYCLGKLSDLSNEDVHRATINQKVCLECTNLGISYWVNNPLYPVFYNNLKHQLDNKLQIVIEKRNQLENDIKCLQSSYSWKITSPLRRTIDFYRSVMAALSRWMSR